MTHHYDPAMHHRRSIRLRGYDYRQAGAYFVTLCTHRREPIFGAIIADTMHRNAYGEIITQDWVWLAEQFTSVALDAFVVMPNHLHGIVLITGLTGMVQTGEGASRGGEGDQPGEGESSLAPTLGRIVGAFKTMSTKHVNEWRETPGASLWQRNYYEHIIRDDADLARIREYIAANPGRWVEDSEYVASHWGV